MKHRSKLAMILSLIMVCSIFTVSCRKKAETDNGSASDESKTHNGTSYYNDDSSDESDNSDGNAASSSSGSGNGSSKTSSSSKTSKPSVAGSSASDSATEDDYELVDLYKSPIQQYGTNTAGSVRSVNVSTQNTVFNGFMSFGANISGGIMTDEGMNKTGINSVYFEIEKKRYLSAKPQFNRVLLPMDYLITNQESNPSRSDWQNNADYINYKNGVYDYNSGEMNAVYKYLDLIKAGGGKVYINMGWGNAKRLWSWYSLRDDTPHNCAPADTKLFAKACVATLEELIIKRGYTNIIGVSFYNEPNGAGFSTIGDKKAYYVSVVNKINSALNNSSLKNKVDIIGPEISNIRIDNHSFLDYLKDKVYDVMSGFSAHNYYTTIKQASSGVTEIIDYNYNYKLGAFLKNYYKKPIYFGEFNTGNYDYNETLTKTAVAASEGSAWTWDTSGASYFISCANSGISGACRWSYSGQFWTDPFGYGSFSNNYQSLWLCPLSLDTVQNGVLDKYYEDSLLTNYVKAGSQVLMTNWTGSDTRVSAFKLPDGNYTVIVEVNDSSANREIRLKFDKNINKTFYRMSFSHNVNNTGNATVQPCDKIFNNVGSSLSDTVGNGYAYYVYTTCKPIKQVELNTVTATCSAGESVQFTPSLVDCTSGDEIIWSICANEGGHVGSINQNGKYISAANAVSGDMVAIKAALKSDLSAYAIAIVKIK